MYFPSAGPPAHRKETWLAGERKRARERDTEGQKGAERNADGGGDGL